MNRREFVRSSVAASLVSGLAGTVAAEPTVQRMNILYVFGDQHRECSMPGKPFSPIVAPTFEAFAKENFVMENCISNYPLCTPHRSILVSGRWPQQTGMDRNGPDKALRPSEYGLGQAFKDVGYRTGYVGKWHLYNGEDHFVPKGPLRFGFDTWRVWGNTNKHYDDFTWDSDSGVMETGAGWAPIPMTTQAIEFIRQGSPAVTKNAQPWMLVVSWNPPHPPFNPPEEDSKPYPKETLPMRPNVALKHNDGSKSPLPMLQNEGSLREAEQGYYGGITGVDKQFQRLLDALEATGQAKNTIVIYTSDHGEMMGTHCRMAKQVPWEESCHVPFFVRIPGAKNRSQSAKDLMGSIDIYPTLCGLAGIPAPKSCMGRDLSGVILGEHASASDGIVVMNMMDGDSNNREAMGYRAVRTLTHTYAVAFDGRWLLYDNVADPYQQNNLVKDPAQKPLMEKLDNVILAWQKETGDKFALLEMAGKVSKQPA
jgi:arylsulfatase A-like enzyme